MVINDSNQLEHNYLSDGFFHPCYVGNSFNFQSSKEQSLLYLLVNCCGRACLRVA